MTTEREITELLADVRECYAMTDEGLDFKRVAAERREAFDHWLTAHTATAVNAAVEAAAVRVETPTAEAIDAMPAGSIFLPERYPDLIYIKIADGWDSLNVHSGEGQITSLTGIGLYRHPGRWLNAARAVRGDS